MGGGSLAEQDACANDPNILECPVGMKLLPACLAERRMILEVFTSVDASRDCHYRLTWATFRTAVERRKKRAAEAQRVCQGLNVITRNAVTAKLNPSESMGVKPLHDRGCVSGIEAASVREVNWLKRDCRIKRWQGRAEQGCHLCEALHEMADAKND